MSKVITGIVLGILFIFGLIGFGIADYKVNYNYEKQIGAYIENAYEVNTPSRMIDEIKLAKQGMIDSGLTESDYGAVWFTKPDNSMKFQYQFLDSVVERAQAVEIWYKNTYEGKVTNTESLGDVYETKMDNLRGFLKENGRADWIAKNAWYVNNHVFFYFSWVIYLLLLLGVGLAFAYAVSDETASNDY